MVLLAGARPGDASVVSLPPLADTHVQAGREAAAEHGGAAQLLVDGEPGKVAYLAFAVPAGVTEATLVLSATNSSPDGGTAYVVPGASWTEGTGRGGDGAGGGLTWNDLDRNRDGVLDAADGSPLTPDAATAVGTLGPVRKGKLRQLDVTAGLTAGAGIYTIALATRSADAAGFASREHATLHRRPVLRVSVADAPAPVPPAPPGGETCLAQDGPLLAVTGTWPTRYAKLALAEATRLDARQATFLSAPENLYPYRVGGGAGICAAGGTVLGQYDRTLSWTAMHDMNNAGVVLKGVGLTVEGVRVDNVTDGIRPESGPFTVRGAWLSYVRDDCVENDHLEGGLIEDSLFDGCYVAVSQRPGPTWTVDGRGRLLTVRRSLVRLAAMPGPRGGAAGDLGHGVFFKWSDLATDLALHDNVFLAEQVSQTGARSMEMPPTLTDCRNNVMVWLGAGDYPAPLPACFTVTRDRRVWDDAVAAWTARHATP